MVQRTEGKHVHSRGFLRQSEFILGFPRRVRCNMLGDSMLIYLCGFGLPVLNRVACCYEGICRLREND
jgi:hypothetical protein